MNAALQSIVHSLHSNPAHAVSGALWLAESECGAVIARSAHSSLHLGVGLRILLATREISPFCSLSTATRPPSWDFITSPSPVSFFTAIFEKSLVALNWTFAFHFFPCELFFLCAQRERERDSSEELCVSTKRACGSLFGFFFWIGWVSLLERKKSMGAQLSKTPGKAEIAVEKRGEVGASPTKTNGQVNEVLSSRLWASITGESRSALEAAAQSVRNCGEIEWRRAVGV